MAKDRRGVFADTGPETTKKFVVIFALVLILGFGFFRMCGDNCSVGPRQTLRLAAGQCTGQGATLDVQWDPYGTWVDYPTFPHLHDGDCISWQSGYDGAVRVCCIDPSGANTGECSAPGITTGGGGQGCNGAPYPN